MRVAISALFVGLLATPAEAKFEVSNVQAAHGVFGPERTSLVVYPLDEVVFRFVVTGASVDAEGRTDVELAFKLVNAGGKAVIDQRGPIQRPLMLGGDTFAAHTQIGIGPSPEPGEYTLKVTLRDRISNETATFERTLTCKPGQFQILAPRFYRDAEAKVPATTAGIVGESLFFRIKAVGYDRSHDEVHATMTMQVLDAKGSEVLAKPMIVKADLTRPEEVKKALQLNFNGAIGLNRVGDYTIRITVEDHVGKQSATFETPLKVAMP